MGKRHTEAFIEQAFIKVYSRKERTILSPPENPKGSIGLITSKEQ